MKKLLELRKKMKNKRPNFIRQDAHKKRLRKRWVKPRGLHSKIRLKKAGHAKKVSAGYRSPKEVRGLSKEGLKIILVHNENELVKVNKETDGIIVASGVGLRNKILLLKKAKEIGIKIINIKVDDYLKRKEDEIKEKVNKKKTRESKRKKNKEENKDQKENKLEEKLSDEEKKEVEKKEKDKLLTKRGAQ